MISRVQIVFGLTVLAMKLFFFVALMLLVCFGTVMLVLDVVGIFYLNSYVRALVFLLNGGCVIFFLVNSSKQKR